MIKELEEVYFLTLIKTIESALAAKDPYVPPLIRVKRALNTPSIFINNDTLLLRPSCSLVIWLTEKEFKVYKSEVTTLSECYSYTFS